MFKKSLFIPVITLAFLLLFMGLGRVEAGEGAGFANDPLASKSYLTEKVTLEFTPLENKLNLIQTNIDQIEQKLKDKI